jgi:hypothetical protein
MGLMSTAAPASATPAVNQAVGLGGSTAQSQETPPDNGGVYIIRNANGKCLEIENSFTQNGAVAQLWDCVGQPGMYWRIGANGTGAYAIVSNHSRECLEIENSSVRNGARAQQWACVLQGGANWFFGGTHIFNASGKCLEIENSSDGNGARAQQWDCVGQSGANWVIQPCAFPCAPSALTSLQPTAVQPNALSRHPAS